MEEEDIMAMILKADLTTEKVSPKNGKKFNLKELQEFVGGFIELVPGTTTAYCNEEGRLKGLPFNSQASDLFGMVLVGNVVVCNKKEI